MRFSAFLVPIHHLAQALGSGDVDRRLVILSLYQAGELSQLLQHNPRRWHSSLLSGTLRDQRG